MKTVIFDFDGTIADTLKPIIKIINELSGDFGFRKVDEKDIEYLRGQRPRTILRHLGISLFKLPFVVRKARQKLNSEISLLKPSSELLPVLRTLKSNGCKVGIVTTNVESNVRSFLHANELDVFDFFYTTKQVFGKHKTLSKIIKDNNLNPSEVYFVGDEIRDIEAGKKAGVRTIGVIWGFNTKVALESAKPDSIANIPKDIEKFVLNL